MAVHDLPGNAGAELRRLELDDLDGIDATVLARFLAKLPQPLARLYWTDAQDALMSGDAPRDTTLCRVAVTFEGNVIVGCEMRFLSGESATDMIWTLEDGELTMTGGGMGDPAYMDASFDGIIWVSPTLLPTPAPTPTPLPD